MRTTQNAFEQRRHQREQDNHDPEQEALSIFIQLLLVIIFIPVFLINAVFRVWWTIGTFGVSLVFFFLFSLYASCVGESVKGEALLLRKPILSFFRAMRDTFIVFFQDESNCRPVRITKEGVLIFLVRFSLVSLFWVFIYKFVAQSEINSLILWVLHSMEAIRDGLFG